MFIASIVGLAAFAVGAATPLTEHVCESRAVGDCECLEATP